MKIRIFAALLILVGAVLGYGVYQSNYTGHGFVSNFPFKLGLDLNGGTHLAYKADTSTLPAGTANDTMNALRDVIERRVNLFGVSEPSVLVEEVGLGTTRDYRLVVELPGVTDIDEAVRQIGETPQLEFKLVDSSATSTATDTPSFIDTGLNGQYLKRALVEFDPTTGAPMVGIEFNEEGRKLFAAITKANVGNILAIFLDGQAISAPVIRQEIREGRAQISGGFMLPEARELVRNLNYGALPVNIELVSTETIGPTLGKAVLDAGVHSGVIAFIVISIFLILWYRLPGVVAVVALALYVVLNLALFKLIPVTLTAAGIAGFILSLGIAVDANILIFERTKEELRRGKSLRDAIHEGFARAWDSIRDSNSSSIITAVILYYFASTSVIKGFALVFGLGVIVSMFTAITATRTMMYALPQSDNKFWRFLFTTGFNK